MQKLIWIDLNFDPVSSANKIFRERNFMRFLREIPIEFNGCEKRIANSKWLLCILNLSRYLWPFISSELAQDFAENEGFTMK